MATLLPSLSSDEEDNLPKHVNKVEGDSDDDDDDENGAINEDFVFGGILVRHLVAVLWLVLVGRRCS